MYVICLRKVAHVLSVTALAVTLSGCTLLQPRPAGDAGQDTAAPVPATANAVQPPPVRVAAVDGARSLVSKGRHQDAVAELERALARKSGAEDVLLLELGMVLASPEVADYPRAREVLNQLLKKHPRSTHRHAAHALADLLEKLDKLNADNEALRQDLKQILDIDLEAERRRRGG